MKFKGTIISTFLLLALMVPVGHQGLLRAEAQFGEIISGGINSLLGGGGASGAIQVRIVSDTAESTIQNTLKTALMELSNAFIGGEISSINLKETVLDPIAWNMAKQLQQQLTGDLLKWLGGQMPGQNGQVPFVQNFSDYYSSLLEGVAGEFISGSRLTGLCSEEENFLVKERVYNSYVQSRSDSGPMFQCSSDELSSNNIGSELDRMFKAFMNCTDVTCAGYKASYELALKQADVFANEKQMLDYSRGMIPQRVCSVVNDPDGRPRQLCKLVNPLYLAEETVTQQLVDMPAEQLLQIDEFNEVVSNLMSNLTNQALQGLTGVLGLSGNADYSSNIFGPSGNLSYVDALVQDDIQSYQSVQGNVIKETLAVEQTYAAMQNFILSEIGDIEDEIEENNCSISLNDELEQAKNTAASNLATASTSIAILSTLDTEYDAAADASIRGSVMSTFISYRSQGLFRTEYENRQFELTYLDITFAQMVDRFRFDHQDCITYDGVLAEEDDEDEEEEE